MAEEWLKVWEDVHFLVLWILVEVQARTIIHVGVLELKLDDVVGCLPVCIVLHSNLVFKEADLLSGHLIAIDLDIGYLLSMEV